MSNIKIIIVAVLILLELVIIGFFFLLGMDYQRSGNLLRAVMIVFGLDDLDDPEE